MGGCFILMCTVPLLKFKAADVELCWSAHNNCNRLMGWFGYAKVFPENGYVKSVVLSQVSCFLANRNNSDTSAARSTPLREITLSTLHYSCLM